MLQHIRNFGILAHVDAGKTTCAERILLFTGKIRRAGEVHLGTTELDWTPQEKARGITITAAVTTTQWAGHRLNLIDTPGHVDFSVEVERSLRVLDGGIVLIDGSQGVEPQTEAVWRRADHHRVPRIVFVNKMDKVGASFVASVASLRARFGPAALPVQLPWGEEAEHRGVLDLLERRALSFEDGQIHVHAIPAELRANVEAARARVVEACADWDASVLAAFAEGRDVPGSALQQALRIGTLTHQAVPVLCGSAYRYRGVQPLLDAVVAYLPSPGDAGHSDAQAPFSGLVFKLMADRHLGSVAFVRVYSGTLRPGMKVLDATRGERVRVGRVLLMHANAHQDLEEAPAGVIAAVVGLGDVVTGTTLCDEGHPVVLGAMQFPETVMGLVLSPKSRADQQKLPQALRSLTLEDPTLKASTDEETGQTLLQGMGELHLEVAVDRLRTDHGVEVGTGEPQVAYRETVTRTAQATHRLKRQTGGPGQFAQVTLEVSPLPRGHGFRFTNATVGHAVPAELKPAVEKGVRGALSRGAQFPLVDLEVRFIDGAAHSHDSNALAFEIAGSLAFQQAVRSAGTVRLEPVMALELVVPEPCVGAVLADLGARRGRVQSLGPRGTGQVIEAHVPLAELFGYVGALRSRTEGRGTVSMRPSHYA